MSLISVIVSVIVKETLHQLCMKLMILQSKPLRPYTPTVSGLDQAEFTEQHRPSDVTNVWRQRNKEEKACREGNHSAAFISSTDANVYRLTEGSPLANTQGHKKKTKNKTQ